MSTVWLVIAKPRTAAGTVVEHRWSAGLATPFVVGAQERIEQLPDFAVDSMAQGFGAGGSSAQPGTLQLLNEDGRLDGLLALSWDDAEIEIYRATGAVADIDDMSLRYRLRGAAVTTADHSIIIAMKNVSAAFDVGLNVPRFAGTGGIEGPAEMANQAKPCCIGPQTAFEGPWVDRSLWIMMLHCRAIDSVSLVTDRGVALTAGGDYATYAALSAADLSAGTHDGKYYTCLAEGCIRLARKPTGLVVADFKGDAGAGGGGYVDRPGAVMTRIVEAFWDGDGITVDTGAMAALDAAFDHPVKLASRDGSERVSDWLETVAVSAGALWWVDRLAALKAKLFAFGGDAAEIADWRATRPERQSAWPRWRRIVLGYRTIGRIHSNDELAEVAVAGQNAAGTLAMTVNQVINSASDPTLIAHDGSLVLYGFSGETPDPSQDGSFIFNGAKTAVARAQYVTGTEDLITVIADSAGTQDGFIVYDAAAPFTVNSNVQKAAFVRRVGASYEYWRLVPATWAAYTPTSGIALGWLRLEANVITASGLFGEAVSLRVAAMPAADVTDYDKTIPFTPVTNGAAGTVVGSTFTKVDGGDPLWDRQVYSRESFSGGAFVSFVPGSNAKGLMIGLNADPEADASYTSLDRAWFCLDGYTSLRIYESSNDRGDFGPYVPGETTLAVLYDGKVTRYLKDGAVVRTVSETSGTYAFHMDSSFRDLGAQALKVNFGPSNRYPRGALAEKDNVNWDADITNIPNFGNMAFEDVVNGNLLVNGTVVASKFLTDQGVNLAAVVPGQLNSHYVDTSITGTPLTLGTPGAESGKYPANPLNIPVAGHRIKYQLTFQYRSQVDTVQGAGMFRIYYRVNGGTWVLHGNPLPFGSGNGSSWSTMVRQFTEDFFFPGGSTFELAVTFERTVGTATGVQVQTVRFDINAEFLK